VDSRSADPDAVLGGLGCDYLVDSGKNFTPVSSILYYKIYALHFDVKTI